MSQSFFTTVMRIDSNLIDRQTIEPSVSVNHNYNYDEWLYAYNYKQLVSPEDKVYKVVEVVSPDTSYRNVSVVERYFVVNPAGYAAAIARRIISPDNVINQSYVYSNAIVLSRYYNNRPHALVSKCGYACYRESIGDIFTPHVKDFRSLLTTKTFKSTEQYINWLDLVALQGWFPAATLYNIQVEEPSIIGWSIPDGSFAEEIVANNDACKMIAADTAISPANREALAGIALEIPLHDFKAVIKMHPVSSQIRLEGYDPLTGEMFTDQQLDRDILACIESQLDILTAYTISLNVNISEDVLTIYKSMNDLLYIYINLDHPIDQPQGVVIDLTKHLFVHYGFVDIPTSCLTSYYYDRIDKSHGL